MIYKIVYHKDVDFDVREAKNYYRKINPELDKCFSDEIKSLIEKIAENPQHYQLSFEKIRSAYLNDFPFGIHFNLSEDTIEIFAIIHTSRNPKIWQEKK